MAFRTSAAADSRRGILVETARGRVVVDGMEMPLTRREAEVVVALAVADRPLTATELGLLLDPDADDREAANLAKVYVHRVRRRLGPDAVVHGTAGYALAAAVTRDVVEARRAIPRVAAIPVAEGERGRLLALAATLRVRPPASLAACEWFVTVAPALQRLGRELALALARAAVARGDAAEAQRIAHDLSLEDSCDDEAWELLLRTYIDAGDTIAALNGFSVYEKELARNLDVGPPEHVRMLVERARQNAQSFHRSAAP